MKEKVVLAYSGGLDTTAIIPWLKEHFDYDVICCCITYVIRKKKDPTNRIRTSDLRKSIYNYSPPLYQLSYGRCPIIHKNLKVKMRESSHLPSSKYS